VRTGPWLSIRTYHPGLHPFPDVMLFNLEDDPVEAHNLAEQRPEIVAQCDRILAEWWQQMQQPRDAAPDPMVTMIQEGGPWYVRTRWNSFLAGLREDGQAWAADELEARHLNVKPVPTARRAARAPSAAPPSS